MGTTTFFCPPKVGLLRSRLFIALFCCVFLSSFGLTGWAQATDSLEASAIGEKKPSRPLNLPVMPGLAKPPGPYQDAATPASPPGTQWENLHERQKKETAYNLRLATLPNGQIKSIPGKPALRSHRLPPPAPSPAAPPPSDPATEKALADLKAYRQRQLAALESDRRTLAALKEAIADLGLNDKLNFVTQGQRPNQNSLQGPSSTPSNPLQAQAQSLTLIGKD